MGDTFPEVGALRETCEVKHFFVSSSFFAAAMFMRRATRRRLGCRTKPLNCHTVLRGVQGAIPDIDVVMVLWRRPSRLLAKLFGVSGFWREFI